MPFEPTEAQRRAIDTRDKSVLLSAAAGSGKTATLTRRIIESLTYGDAPTDLSRMLVVTFTRAAAAELRERISAALSTALAENPSDRHLIRQTVILGSAEICTIDSFCLDTVRSGFQRLTLEDGSPLPPDFRLADDTELDTLRLSVMNSVIDSWYDKTPGTLDFGRFVDNFSGTRDEGTLTESLIGYAQFLDGLRNPDGFTSDCAAKLKNDAERDFFDTDAGAFIRDRISSQFGYYRKIAAEAVSEFSDGDIGERNYKPAFVADVKFFDDCINALKGSYTEARQAINSYSPARLASLGKKKDETSEGYQSLRNEIKEGIKKLASKYFTLDSEAVSALALRTAADLETLSALMSDFRKAYSREKQLRRIAEFSDIKRLAHRLLVSPDGSPTGAAEELRERYDAVYIDEYQDVDRVQDELFAAVSRPGCRFVVGDIKQSIYSFRGAEPDIFGGMRDSLPDYGSKEAEAARACTLFMSENFRCDAPIIDFVNRVSRCTFVPAGGTVGYRDEDDLVCGKRGGGSEPVRVALFAKPEAEEPDGEITYVVNEIKRLVADGKKNDGTKITCSDIAVICRDNRLVRTVSAALGEAGVETTDETASDFFGNPEIQLVLSLVCAVDNPEKDIPLAAALRSPFFGFSMDELVRIRQSADSSYSLFEAAEALAAAKPEDGLTVKCAALISRLEALRADARGMPVDRFIRRLWREFRVMSLTSPGDSRTPARVSVNLRRFYEYARRYAATQNGGLSGFIAFIGGIIEGNTKVSAPGFVSPDGAVTLMSVHKSKGLEFPVVFVCGCGKSFNRKDLGKTLIYHTGLGVAVKLTDDTGFARTDTPQRTALALAVGERQTEEEMRILYVALTRARERLYVTATVSGEPDAQISRARFASRFACRESVLNANGFLGWLLPAIVQENGCFTLVTQAQAPETGCAAEEAEEVKKNDKNVRETQADIPAMRAELRKRFEFVYPYAAAERIPAKLSVSELYPAILDDNGAAGLETDSLPELREKPLFMCDSESEERRTAAERGTATHVFLQFCDFSRAARDVRGELLRLVEGRFIPPGTAALVSIRQLENFFRSDFYKSLSGAKRVWRERRFNLLLPAADFTSQPELAEKLGGEKLLVQGVIDLFFTDAGGETVLCDYKTDYFSREELSDEAAVAEKLFSRHARQLGYYAEAVGQLLGRKPDRICIYSLPLGKAVYSDNLSVKKEHTR